MGRTRSPAATGQPSISVAAMVIRATVGTGVSNRSSSSTAPAARPGSSASWRWCAGLCARNAKPHSSVSVTVSSPAASMSRQMFASSA
jgi:hypothetical protein